MSVVKVWQNLVFKVALELYIHVIKIHHINGERQYLIISKMSMKKKIITKQYASDNWTAFIKLPKIEMNSWWHFFALLLSWQKSKSRFSLFNPLSNCYQWYQPQESANGLSSTFQQVLSTHLQKLGSYIKVSTPLEIWLLDLGPV